MTTQTFHIEINAPKQKVWEIMLGDKTYPEWTAAFHEGSFFEGSWEKGSDMQFLAEDDGKKSGMDSKIVENIPYEYISIEHGGFVDDGIVDTTSENVKQWIGAHENYIYKETNGITSLTIELEGKEIDESVAKMFEDTWPNALNKLKEIAER